MAKTFIYTKYIKPTFAFCVHFSFNQNTPLFYFIQSQYRKSKENVILLILRKWSHFIFILRLFRDKYFPWKYFWCLDYLGKWVNWNPILKLRKIISLKIRKLFFKIWLDIDAWTRNSVLWHCQLFPSPRCPRLGPQHLGFGPSRPAPQPSCSCLGSWYQRLDPLRLGSGPQ